MHSIRRQAHCVTSQSDENCYNPFARQRSPDVTPDTGCGEKLALAKQMPGKNEETKDIGNPQVVRQTDVLVNPSRNGPNRQQRKEDVNLEMIVAPSPPSPNRFIVEFERLLWSGAFKEPTQPSPWSTSLSYTLHQYVSKLLRSLKGSPGPFTSLSLMTLLIPSVAAQAPEATPNMTWRQRAMQVLTSAAASCAFLVPPAIILLLGGSMSHWLLRKRREHALGGMMLFMALVYASIKVGPKADPTGSNEIIRTAVGLVYLLFMLGYCRRVILRNERGQGTSVKATLVGVGIGLAMIAIAPFRDLWKLTGVEPVFLIPLTIPLGFLLCDLEIAVEAAFARRTRDARGANQDFDVESQMRGRYYSDSTDVWADLHYRRPYVTAAQDYEMDDGFHVDSPTIVHPNPWADTPSAPRGFWGRYFSWANFF
jgi:hypothetical protein